MRSLRATRIALAAGMLVFVATFGQTANAQNAPDTASVVLVCEHGSVKSLIAASLFNESARARGLPFRAVARGVTPDASVPASIAAALERDGFDVQKFKPTVVSKTDVAQANHVVAIGVDLTPAIGKSTVPVEHWDDVPAATVDYPSARASLKQHVDALLNRMQHPRGE